MVNTAQSRVTIGLGIDTLIASIPVKIEIIRQVFVKANFHYAILLANQLASSRTSSRTRSLAG